MLQCFTRIEPVTRDALWAAPGLRRGVAPHNTQNSFSRPATHEHTFPPRNRFKDSPASPHRLARLRATANGMPARPSPAPADAVEAALQADELGDGSRETRLQCRKQWHAREREAAEVRAKALAASQRCAARFTRRQRRGDGALMSASREGLFLSFQVVAMFP